MDKTKWIAVHGLAVSTYLLTRDVPTSFAFDKPVHSSVLILATCAVAIIGLSRLLPHNNAAGKSHKGQQYDALPLEEFGQPHASRDLSPGAEDVRYPSSLRKLRITFIGLVVAICLRVETWRGILGNTQCATASWAPLIPLVLAFWDYWTIQRHKKPWILDDPESSVYEALEENTTRAQYRYVLAAGLLSFGSGVSLHTTSAPRSTYICAASLPSRWLLPLLQHVGSVLDLVILYCINQLITQSEGRGTRSLRLRFNSVGWASLFSACTLLTIGFVCHIITADAETQSILALPRLYIGSIAKLSVFACFAVICTLLTVSQHPRPSLCL
jgi:hypothetical protein